MPLFRETVKEHKNLDLNHSFEAAQENLNFDLGARRSCPDEQRQPLSSILKHNSSLKHKVNMLKLKADIEAKSSFSVCSDTNSTLTLKLIGKPEKTKLMLPEIK